MLKSIICVIAMAATVPANAETADLVAQSEFVRFDDLDLASARGVEALDRRIQSSARRVCGYDRARDYSLIVPRQVTECMTNAIAGARQDVAAKTGSAIRKG